MKKKEKKMLIKKYKKLNREYTDNEFAVSEIRIRQRTLSEEILNIKHLLNADLDQQLKP